MADTPFWIAFGDTHDDISLIARIPGLEKALGVIVSGDITFCGGELQAARVLGAIAERNPVIYAQIGNMDLDEVISWLDEKGYNLHARARELFPEVFAVGVGYSTFTPFGTPSEASETSITEWMEQGLAAAGRLSGKNYTQEGGKGLVLISHTPPKGTACDKLKSGVSVGSIAVRNFIEKYQPDICLCGHIHESRAVDRLGRTVIVNPGDLASGGFVIIRQEFIEGAFMATAELMILS